MTDPARPHDRHALLDLGERPELLVRIRVPGPLLAAETVDRDVACLVPERRERAQEHDERVGRRAPVLARMLVARERPHLDRDARVATQGDGERRLSGTNRAAVGDQDGVRAKRLRVRRRIPLLQGASHLLLTFDQELDPDWRLAVPGAKRADVDEDVALRVRRPPSVDRAVALCRLERRRCPERLVAGWHDVVVTVEQNRRRTVGGGDLARDHRCGALELDGGEALDPRVTQQLENRLVRLEQRRPGVLREAPLGQRGDCHEPCEILCQPRHQRGNRRGREWTRAHARPPSSRSRGRGIRRSRSIIHHKGQPAQPPTPPRGVAMGLARLLNPRRWRRTVRSAKGNPRTSRPSGSSAVTED